MARADQNPWRRGPAESTSGVPISAQTAVPLNPSGRGPSDFGFFTLPSKALPHNSIALGKIPISAMAGKVKNGMAA